MTKQHVLKALALCCAVHPSFDLTDATRDAYVALLADLDGDDLLLATQDVLASSAFFPKPAELRQRMSEHRIRKANVPLPLEAWGEVMAEVTRCSVYVPPRFSSPLILEVVKDVGGWPVLVEMTMADVAAHRARFVEAYTARMGRAQSDDALPPAVAQKVLPQGGGMKSLAQLMQPLKQGDAKQSDRTQSPPPKVKRVVHYRAGTKAEYERGEAVTPEQLRAETIIRGVKEQE